jgi:hypothetical protein
MSHEIQSTLTGPAVNHAWGSSAGTLSGASCDGSIAFSYYRGGPVGGTFFLWCSDATLIGGRVASADVSPTDSGWRLTARIIGIYRDGG